MNAPFTPGATAAPIRVVLVGHVDHGKSTLTGRLLADSGALPDGKLEGVRQSCERRGVPFEYAFVLDALEAERDQNVTIDASTVWLRLPDRTLVLVDAPGHREFLKNMVTGAASADAAVLLVAADEGVREQSRRHGQLLGLLGVKQVIVVVNKLDRVGRSREKFVELEKELRAFLATVGVEPRAFVPVVARAGENVVSRSESMPWYRGGSVLDELRALDGTAADGELPLRMFVQDVYRFDDRRIVAGRIDSGVIRVGDRVRFSPSGAVSTVKSIERWAVSTSRARVVEANVAVAGESIGITLADPIFVERGQVTSLDERAPRVGRKLRARIFWLGRRPLDVDRPLKLRLCTLEEDVRVVAIERAVDAGSLTSSRTGDAVRKDEVADVVLEARAPIAFDVDRALTASSRFVLVDDSQDGARDVAGGGLVLGAIDDSQDGALTLAVRAVDDRERERRFGHKGAVVAVPEGADAHAIERALFERGLFVAIAHDANEARALSRAGLVALVERAACEDDASALRSRSDTLVDDVVGAVAVRGRRGGRDAA
jgi:bifunctional enzyme CysN/CysC